MAKRGEKTAFTNQLVAQIDSVTHLQLQLSQIKAEYRQRAGKIEKELLMWERRVAWTRVKLRDIDDNRNRPKAGGKARKTIKKA